MTNWKTWLPLGMFVVFLAIGAAALLWPADNTIESQMVGKPLPEFALPPAVETRAGLSAADLRTGKPMLLNIFASWCVPCRAESPHLATLAAAGATIHGVDIRDTQEDVSQFLTRYGNPYSRIGSDEMSKVQLAIGSSGVPETFVIDGAGHIIYQHIGDVRARDVPMLLEKLRDAE